VPFHVVSSTANRLNVYIREQAGSIEQEEKRALASRIFAVMESRADEAYADDFSRMAWLAIHLGQEGVARSLVNAGLEQDPHNNHCQRLATRLET
jgi:hypothetical protein